MHIDGNPCHCLIQGFRNFKLPTSQLHTNIQVSYLIAPSWIGWSLVLCSVHCLSKQSIWLFSSCIEGYQLTSFNCHINTGNGWECGGVVSEIKVIVQLCDVARPWLAGRDLCMRAPSWHAISLFTPASAYKFRQKEYSFHFPQQLVHSTAVSLDKSLWIGQWNYL